MQKPLADLLRPETLDDMVGQSHLLSKGSTFRKVIDSGHISNMIFYGPPGIGKTTMANIIAKKANTRDPPKEARDTPRRNMFIMILSIVLHVDASSMTIFLLKIIATRQTSMPFL